MQTPSPLLCLCLALAWVTAAASAPAAPCPPTAPCADTLFVRQLQVPLLVERQDNVLMELRLHASTPHHLDAITLTLSADTPPEAIRAIRLYYSGTDSRPPTASDTDALAGRWSPADYIPASRAGLTLSADPSCSLLLSEVRPTDRVITLRADRSLSAGVHFLWVSLQWQPDADLDVRLSADLTAARADDGPLAVVAVTPPVRRRPAIGLRHAGDDGVAAYRIPGLVTTPRGTLLATYDVRRLSSADLQGAIDIGLSRSTTGGRSWEPMRIALSMGEWGGLPKAQNGVGDPCILVDHATGDILILALWTHGMGGRRAWTASAPGIDPAQTGQLLMVRSSDDGQTWSAPVNLTAQVKRPEWRLLLQGPGRGICMADGTLVAPIQYIDADGLPHAGIIFSRDHGTTWTFHRPARDNVTEAQVAEIAPGTLMLNMRDNRGGSRAVAITTDLGRTWTDHPSSRSALIDPVCMAALLAVEAEDNACGRDLLLFSNPADTSHRRNITLRVSLDGGLTWPDHRQVLLDAGDCWGYSCLTLIDPNTVGIAYESSTAHIIFQRISLDELLGEP